MLVARTLIEHPGGDPEAALALATDRLLAVYAREPAFASVLRGLLAHRSSVKKPGGGWVLDSFWSAWEAFASSGSYRETIERAVGYGNDTDTTAAIAGGLAGIRWGLDEAAAASRPSGFDRAERRRNRRGSARGVRPAARRGSPEVERRARRDHHRWTARRSSAR